MVITVHNTVHPRYVSSRTPRQGVSSLSHPTVREFQKSVNLYCNSSSLWVVRSWSDVCRARPINWPAVRCVIIGSNSGPQPMMDGKLCRWVFILLALVNTTPQYTCSASTQVDMSLPLGDANPKAKCGVVLYFHINKCAGGTVEQWLNHRAGAFISAYHRPTTFATSPSDGSRIWIEFERNITK